MYFRLLRRFCIASNRLDPLVKIDFSADAAYLGSVLVIFTFAVSIVLLIGAGLLQGLAAAIVLRRSPSVVLRALMLAGVVAAWLAAAGWLHLAYFA